MWIPLWSSCARRHQNSQQTLSLSPAWFFELDGEHHSTVDQIPRMFPEACTFLQTISMLVSAHKLSAKTVKNCIPPFECWSLWATLMRFSSFDNAWGGPVLARILMQCSAVFSRGSFAFLQDGPWHSSQLFNISYHRNGWLAGCPLCFLSSCWPSCCCLCERTNNTCPQNYSLHSSCVWQSKGHQKSLVRALSSRILFARRLLLYSKWSGSFRSGLFLPKHLSYLCIFSRWSRVLEEENVFALSLAFTFAPVTWV